jgi:hypothetical protein
VPRNPNWGGGLHTWDVEAEGSIWSPNKNFLIDHPLDPERCFLVHGCLEGPESGVFYRGTASLENGHATVALPDYFEALTRAEDRTVMLTPVCGGEDAPVSMLAASRVENGSFDVRAVDGASSEQEFYWQVMAVRSDLAPLDVEIDKLRSEEPELARPAGA